MPGRWRGRAAHPECQEHIHPYDPYDSAGWRVRRGWKQAPTIFWLLPVWSSAWSSDANCANCAATAATARRAKAQTQNIAPLSLEGVSQMVYFLPERLLALVRPAFDLVLRRIRSLKRCVQACGCKIMTPRYAVWQNAQQLPFFLQGERPQRKPWLAFLWLLAGFLAGLVWLLAGFLAGWLGSWLAFWLVWLLAGFLAGLAWLLAGFLAGLVWLLAGFLAVTLVRTSRRRACPTKRQERWTFAASRSWTLEAGNTEEARSARRTSCSFSGEHMAQRKKIVIASFGNDPKPRDICNVLRHKCYSSRVYMYVRPVSPGS